MQKIFRRAQKREFRWTSSHQSWRNGCSRTRAAGCKYGAGDVDPAPPAEFSYFVAAVASPGSPNETCRDFAHFRSTGFNFCRAACASVAGVGIRRPPPFQVPERIAMSRYSVLPALASTGSGSCFMLDVTFDVPGFTVTTK